MRPDDYFYSATIDRYISKKPVYVSSEVLKAADAAGVTVKWDKKGRIHRVPFADAQKLLTQMGSELMTPKQYFSVLSEVKALNREDLINAIETTEYAEWLNVVYRVIDDKIYMVERPTEDDIARLQPPNTALPESAVLVDLPQGRPGWFNFDIASIDATGHPQNVREKKAAAEQDGDDQWKYWRSQRKDVLIGDMRGWVLSSNTNSLDLDIPLIARHPKIMLREVRATLDGLKESNDQTKAALALIEDYKKTLILDPMERKDAEVDAFFSDFAPKAEIIDQYRKHGIVEDDLTRRSIDEAITDILGKHKAFTRANTSDETEGTLLTRSALLEYLRSTPARLEEALTNKDKVILVRGHDNPDADVVFSTVFEAFRRSKLTGELCVPVVSGTITADVVEVLGKDICDEILHTSSPLYKEAESSGLARWTYVDTHETENDEFLDSVIDHRMFKREFPHYVATSNEVGWSATLQVYAKILGSGLDLDKEMSEILLSGTLLEAEYGLIEKVMRKTDRLLYDDLVRRSECPDPEALYTEVIQPLLAPANSETLFNRDYKQSGEMLGFSVVKQSNFYDAQGQCVDEKLRSEILDHARKNNETNNLPLTVVKIIDYCPDGVKVNCEEILTVFNAKWHDIGFKTAISDVLKTACENYHRNNAEVICTPESVKIPSANVQLPRLLLAPLLTPLTDEHAKFFYSPHLGKYVARGFYDGDPSPYSTLYPDAPRSSAKNFISFQDMKTAVDTSENVSVMTLADYWKVFAEADKANDKNMLASLQDPNFVEMLDTFIENSRHIFNHPHLDETGEPDQTSPCIDAPFERAHPGLMLPLDVDGNGVPKTIYHPDEYDDARFWRYWSPDIKKAVACRGYIFLLEQPAQDLKVQPTEKHRNMGFRPLYKEIPELKYDLTAKDNWVTVKIRPRSFGIYDRPERPAANAECSTGNSLAA